MGRMSRIWACIVLVLLLAACAGNSSRPTPTARGIGDDGIDEPTLVSTVDSTSVAAAVTPSAEGTSEATSEAGVSGESTAEATSEIGISGEATAEVTEAAGVTAEMTDMVGAEATETLTPDVAAEATTEVTTEATSEASSPATAETTPEVSVQENTGWQIATESLNVNPDAFAGTPSLAFGSDGTGAIAWVEDQQVYVRQWTGSAWVPLAENAPLNQNADFTATQPAVAIDLDGSIAVAWQECCAEDGRIRLHAARWNGSAWEMLGESVTGEDETTADATPPQLVASSEGLVIAWRETGKDEQDETESQSFYLVQTRRWDGSAWVMMSEGIATNAAVSGDSGGDVFSLEVLPDGRPVLAWMEMDQQGDLVLEATVAAQSTAEGTAEATSEAGMGDATEDPAGGENTVDPSAENLSARVLVWNGTEWEALASPIGLTSTTDTFNITVGADGLIYALTRTAVGAVAIQYWSENDLRWVPVDVPEPLQYSDVVDQQPTQTQPDTDPLGQCAAEYEITGAPADGIILAWANLCEPSIVVQQWQPDENSWIPVGQPILTNAQGFRDFVIKSGPSGIVMVAWVDSADESTPTQLHTAQAANAAP